MKQLAALKTLVILVASLVATTAVATDGTDPDATVLERWNAAPETVFNAGEVDLADFMWIARPIVIFADAPAVPSVGQQLDLLEARMAELVERDVILIVDTDPAAKSDIRQKLRPRGFMLTLIGKDGRVFLRKPFPWNVREITRSIDKQPIRKQELIDQLRAE